MKKWIALIAVLALATVSLSGCDFDDLLGTLLERSVEAKGDAVPEMYALTDDEYAYEMDDMGGALYMAMPAPAYGAPDDFNTEEYAAVAENGFRDVASSPLSTFSADVDTASYCNLRRMLNSNWAPGDIPSGAVRVEEMLNYFRYDYPAPEDGRKFGVQAQIAACPWNPEHALLLLGVRAADAPDAVDEGSNLVFLVDVSGSMGDRNKLDLVKQALTMLADQLTEKDTVSICTYSDGERVLVEGANPVKDRAKLLSAIDALEAAGYTDGQRGLEQAYDVALRNLRPRGNNRVIMCSDGDLNVGITSESDLHDYVSEKKETGIYRSEEHTSELQSRE